MLLNIDFCGQWRYPRGATDVGNLVAAVSDEEDYQAWFWLALERYSDTNVVPGVFLHVSVAVESGFGAVTWGFIDGFDGAEPDGLWIADNPEPPTVDPGVVVDADAGLIYDRRSAIPLESVRAVIEEFCQAATAKRPSAISWVEERMNGQRFEPGE